MVQNQPTTDNSGMGVVLGILLAVVIVVGAFFFLRGGDDLPSAEPAAGMDTPATSGMDSPSDTYPATPSPAPAQ